MIRNASNVFTMVNDVDDRRFKLAKNVLLGVSIFVLVITLIKCIVGLAGLALHFEQSMDDYTHEEQEKIRPSFGLIVVLAVIRSIFMVSIAALQVYAIHREHFCLIMTFAIIDVIGISMAIVRGIQPYEIPMLMCYVLIASLMIYFAWLIRQRCFSNTRISAAYII